MTWLALRQFRVQAIVAGLFLLGVGTAFALTGPHLLHVYDTTVQHCAAHGDCGPVDSAFGSTDRLLQHLIEASVIVPALMGAFWGAPLAAREFESGTFRLAWTQGVTRTTWLVTRIAVGALASIATAGLFSLMATWWSSPLDRLHNTPFGMFDSRDLVPMGYAAFGFTLGVGLGLLIKRTLPAMAATFVLFAAVRVAFTDYVRVHFAAALHASQAFMPFTSPGRLNIASQGVSSADWVVSDQTVNQAGKVIGLYGGIGPNGSLGFSERHGGVYFNGVGRCPNLFPPGPVSRFGTVNGPHSVHDVGPVSRALAAASEKCVTSFHLRELLTFQPPSRYWGFQWYELGSYVSLSALLIWLSIWWIRRH